MNIDEYGQLIHEIYDLSADREDWTRLLARIAEACEAGSASIASGNRAQGLSVTCSVVTPDQIEEYRTTWAQVDPSMAALAMAAPGQYVTLDMIGGRDAFRRTEVYNGFWLKTDHSPEHLRTKLHQDRDGWMVFAVNARKRDHELLNSTVENFGRFLPHLARAAEIQRRLRSAFLREAAERHAPGTPGVFLVNAAGRVIYNDAQAELILETARGLSRQSGYLEFDVAADTAAFLGLLHSCGAVLPGPSARGGKMQTRGQSRLDIDVMPMSEGGADLGLEFLAETGAVALVLIDDPERNQRNAIAKLREAYGLTRTEAKVAIEAMTASSRKVLAARLGVSESTVRTHLSRIYEKTGTGRQAHLIQMLSRHITGSGR